MASYGKDYPRALDEVLKLAATDAAFRAELLTQP